MEMLHTTLEHIGQVCNEQFGLWADCGWTFWADFLGRLCLETASSSAIIMADIDMVDFFDKQSGTDSRLRSHVNAKSLHHHVHKAKGSMDDRMPGDVVSPPGSAFSAEGSRKALSGDSLLSSLDGM